MPNKVVTYNQFQPNKLKGSEPVFKNPTPTISFFDQKLSYNYGTDEQPIVQDVFVEGCELTAVNLKIEHVDKVGKNGPYVQEKVAVMFSFDLSDDKTHPEVLGCLEFFKQLRSASGQHVYTYRNKIKKHEFNPETGLKNPVYEPRDDSGQLTGRSSSLWAKFHTYRTNRTIISDLNGNAIDWKLLQNTEMRLIPVWHIEKNYIGAEPSIQIYLSSAILTSVKQGGPTVSEERLEQVKQQNAGLADQVEAQLAALRMNVQDSFDRPPVPNESTDFGSDMGDAGTMHSMEDTSVADFLSGAPTMNGAPTPSQSAPQTPAQSAPQPTPTPQVPVETAPPQSVPQSVPTQVAQSVTQPATTAPRLNVQMPPTMKIN